MESHRKILLSPAELANIIIEASNKSRVPANNAQEIEAVKPVKADNADLETENAAFKAEIAALMTENAALKADNSSLERKIGSLYTDLEKAKASPLPESDVRVTISWISKPTENHLNNLWRQRVEGTDQKGKDIEVSFHLGTSQYKDENALDEKTYTGWTFSAELRNGRYQADHRTANLRSPTPTLGDHLGHQQLSDDNGFLPLPDGDNLDN